MSIGSCCDVVIDVVVVVEGVVKALGIQNGL